MQVYRSSLIAWAAFTTVALNGCRGTSPHLHATSLQFSNSGVVYDIPRSYLEQLHSPVIPDIYLHSVEQPSIATYYPGFAPASEHDVCGNWFAVKPRPSCYKLEFIVSGGKGPSREQMAKNAERPYTSEYKKTGTDEYGFRMWWSNRVPETIDFTRGSGRNFLFFFCNVGVDAAGVRDGPCVDVFRLSDGNSAALTFPYHLRDQLPAIEAGIDHLMQRFRKK